MWCVSTGLCLSASFQSVRALLLDWYSYFSLPRNHDGAASLCFSAPALHDEAAVKVYSKLYCTAC